MFKIGEFSKLSQVPVKLLRRYDQLGLLPPIHVDERTGYRYYSAQQLMRLQRIQAFRDLGFTLKQIGRLLREDLPLVHLREMFRRKHAELQQLMDTQQAKLARIETRLRQIEREGELPPYEVVLKHVAPQAVASIREVIAPSRLPDLFGELDDYLSYYGISPSRPHSVLWHGTHAHQGRMDIEVSCVLTQPLARSHRIMTGMLPEVAMMACVLHLCRPGNSCNACIAIDSWIEEHGYCFSGAAAREVYLPQEEESGSFSLAEMQIPIERREEQR
jgi:DNA-binding transcriptional MerR regulator